MLLQSVNGNRGGAESKVPEKFTAAFLILLEASDYARQTSGDLWEFAVEIERLRDVGLSLNDLRWLVRMRYVQHAREVTLEEQNGRTFRSSGDLTFTAETCFVPTERCIATSHTQDWSKSLLSVATHRQTPIHGHASSSQGLTPRWSPEIRELWMGDTLIKRFKWQALNQERILTAFEEDGWPTVIDDPLPPRAAQDPKRRLHDTIKSLNRNQSTEILSFHGNGNGQGVRWGLLDGRHRNDE